MAGIRDLAEGDRDKLLEIVARYSKRARFRKEVRSGQITGEEEALYGWVAANYLKNNFTEDNIKKNNTNGYVEMGGASSQIAFRPNEFEKKDFKGKLTEIALGVRNYILFTQTDGLGANKAWRHHQLELLRKIKPTLEDPSLPLSATEKLEGKTIRGTADYNMCKHRQFIGGDQFYNITREVFGLDAEGEPLKDVHDFSQFEKEVRRFSETEWTKLQEAKRIVSRRFLLTSFFMAAWITNVLKGYRFQLNDADFSPSLQPFKGDDRGELNWALGRIILHAVSCTPIQIDSANVIASDLSNTWE